MFKAESRISSKGIQSEVEVGTFEGVRVVRKVSGVGLTPRELVTVGRSIEPYRRRLQKSGLNPPKNVRTRVRTNDIEIIDDLIEGPTVEQSVSQGRTAGLRRMVKAVINAEGTFVDAKTPNFIEEDHRVRCVDTFPPMLRARDRKIAPWVAKLFKRDRDMMSFNFGDVRGQMTKLLSLANIQEPERYEQVRDEVLSELRGSISKEDYRYISEQARQGFPDMQEMYRHPDRAREIVKRASRRSKRFVMRR